MTTEFGEDDCSDDFMRAYMSWADADHGSYLAWTWAVNLHRVCVPGFAGQGADLSLLQGWDGTPSRSRRRPPRCVRTSPTNCAR